MGSSAEITVTERFLKSLGCVSFAACIALVAVDRYLGAAVECRPPSCLDISEQRGGLYC